MPRLALTPRHMLQAQLIILPLWQAAPPRRARPAPRYSQLYSNFPTFVARLTLDGDVLGKVVHAVLLARAPGAEELAARVQELIAKPRDNAH